MPMGNTITVGSNRVHALVIDRARMDEKLVVQAEETGAELAFGTRLARMDRNENCVCLNLQRGRNKSEQQINARMVIGADGSYSVVTNEMGARAAERYRTVWMDTVGLELQPGRMLGHLLVQLTPMETKQLLQLFTLKEVREVKAAHGDIDYPVHLFAHLFRPAVVFRVLRALPLRLGPKLAWLLVQWYRRVSTHQPSLQARPA